MIPLDEARLTRTLGSETVEKAREYVRKGRVLEAHVESGGRIRGIVKGSEWKPYEQRIALTPESIDGLCTCPVGTNCKHVAAVLLDLMGQDEDPPEIRTANDPAVVGWLASVERLFADPNAYPPDVSQRVLYILGRDERGFWLEVVTARALRGGGYGKPVRLNLNSVYSNAWPPHVLPVDARILESVVRGLTRLGYEAKYRIVGGEAARLLPEILATHRCMWEEPNGPPVGEGPAVKGALRWVEAPDGSQSLRLDVAELRPIPTAPPWYWDESTHTCGVLDLNLPDWLVATLLQAPPIGPEDVDEVRDRLERLLPGRPELLPNGRQVERRHIRPTPVLRIERVPVAHVGYGAWRRPAGTEEIRLPVARLSFDYDGVLVRQGTPGEEVRHRHADGVVVFPRRKSLEGRAATPLLESGWTPARQAHGWRLPKTHADDYVFLAGAEGRNRVPFFRFLRHEVPSLREQGWRIELEEGVELFDEVELRVEAHERGDDWFDLDLGVVVDGERLPLRPLLLQALDTLKGEPVESLRDDFELYHELPDGRVLVVSGARLRPLLAALGELLGRPQDWPDALRFERGRAGELAVLDQRGVDWKASPHLRALQSRLASFDGIRAVEAPKELRGELRSYQQEGLNWLQFLREAQFGGILADDMGLGKTVQTLAHLLKEKEAGRLEKPALIVAPTSTVPNWRAEAARFAPSLRTLVLRGAERHALIPSLPDHDLVITTYPLLARDRELLDEQEFSVVVLDEAQNIKNPSAAVAKAAKALKADARLCLSGTPVENRLDELWSLFDFLMPGFLGSLTRFRKEFRGPIEAKDDNEAKRRLARRVRPFVLRRTKDVVAPELPEKTTVVEQVELEGAQRDLYESLRLVMDERVRELLKAKGMDKGRIEILDALLKLRQACCDPRLVNLEAARGVEGSAKLDRLMELLGELLAEGRRVLVFSQFTSMLDLIEDRLRAAKVDWVRISGDTEDRETPVRRFQSGEVPVFLISLRAGGTGLNLTAADTVIHYDPWWNPAVEAQATDRAHRIGQTKAVLVVKLVAEGTVEERILELQERKSRLAEAVLDGDFEASLTADELRWVLQDSREEGSTGPDEI